jgi:catechol 2,3-dioxygenase-like lactoylglutathione lyase family enzyme
VTTVERQPRLEWSSVCIDCANADELAIFYSQLLGWEVGYRNTSDHGGSGDAGWVSMPNPAGGIGLCFQGMDDYAPPVWPDEPDRRAKMMHFEIAVDDVPAAVEVAIRAGAAMPAQPVDRDPSSLRVLLDPAGHPFCLFAAADLS